MNREVLFRGKRVDNGEWIEGFFAKSGDKTFILIDNDIAVGYVAMKEVIAETVGQFTDLTDKNGKKIFEGDIVCIRYRTGEICCSGDVQFSYGVYGAEWLENKKDKSMVGGWGQLHNLRRFDDDIINDIEVIGNIYDNPELLEDKQ